MDDPVNETTSIEINRETLLKLGGASGLAAVAALLAQATPAEGKQFTPVPLGLDFTATSGVSSTAYGHKLTVTAVPVKRIFVTENQSTIPTSPQPTAVYSFAAPYMNGQIPVGANGGCTIQNHHFTKTIYVAVWT